MKFKQLCNHLIVDLDPTNGFQEKRISSDQIDHIQFGSSYFQISSSSGNFKRRATLTMLYDSGSESNDDESVKESGEGQGRWTIEEHQSFLAAIKIFGREVRDVWMTSLDIQACDANHS